VPSTSDPLTRLRRLAAVVLWIAAGGGLLTVAFLRLEPARLGAQLAETAIGVLLLAGLLDVAVAATKALKWHLVLRPVGVAPVHRLLGAFYCGAAATAVLPFRLDEFVRAYAAHRFTGLPGLKVLGSMALERLVDFVALLLMMVLLATLLPLPDFLRTAMWVVIGVVAVLIAVLVGLQLTARRAGDGPLGRLAGGLAGGSQALRHPGLLVGGLGVTLVEWGITLAVVRIVLAGVGVELPLGGVLLVVALFMGSFALPLAPAGIGVFEVAMRLALPPLYGVSEEAAVVAAVAVHAVLLVPVVLVGAAVMVSAGIRLHDVRRFREESGRA